MNLEEMLKNAGQLLDMGQVEQARNIYQSVCAQQPHHEALLMLGAIEAESGNVDVALQHIQASIAAKPDYADAYVTLGTIYQHMQQFDKAHECFLQATGHDEAYEEAWQYLSSSFGRQANYPEAERCARKALSIDPSYTDPKINLANALKSQGKAAEAVQIYQELANAGINNPELSSACASAAYESGQYELAGSLYEKILAQGESTSADTRLRVAELCHINGDKDAAVNHYQQILDDPALGNKARTGLAMVWADMGQVNDAEDALSQVLQAEPGNIEAMFGLGKILYKTGRVQAAIERLQAVINLTETNPAYQRIYYEAFSVFMFAHNYTGGDSAQQVADLHRQWADKFTESSAGSAQGKDSESAKAGQASGRKVRIAYLSPDFRRHSVAFFIEPLLAGHNREQFEVIGLSDTRSPDSTTGHLKSLCDQWHDVSTLSDDDLRQTIKEQAIDILVDLAGHTTNHRMLMLAHRTAPVQVSGIGYPNTTGLSTIDYRLTDAIADPEGSESHHSEKLARLDHCFLCYSPYAQSPAVSQAPVASNGHITFGSFNTIEKMTDTVLQTWAKILQAQDNSRLLLKNPAFANGRTRERVLGILQQQGIDASRIELVDLVPSYTDHMNTYSKLDIALDTFPYNGTTTTCEAMWMGVPVITLKGDSHAGRVGASLLTHTGHESWIARDEKDYIQLALDMAKLVSNDGHDRSAQRQRMQDSILCNAKAYAESMDALYLSMLQD